MKNRFIILFIICLPLLSNAQQSNSYITGLALLKQKNYNEACISFNKAIELGLHKNQSIFNRGKCHFFSNEYNLAESDFTEAKTNNINEANLWLAKLFAKNINPISSVKYLQEYLTKASPFEAQAAIADSIFKSIYFSNEWFNLVSQRESNSFDQAMKDLSYAKKTNNYTEASKRINELIAEDQDNAYLYYARAQVYLANNNLPLAIVDFNKSYQLKPDDIVLKEQLADAFAQNKAYKKAQPLYDELYSDHPEEFNNYIKAAQNALYANEAEKAQKYIDAYLIYFNTDSDALFISSQINYSLENYLSALRSINKLLLNETPKEEWYLLRGKCYFATGTYKYANADFSMALDLDPNDPEANLYMGKTYQKTGKMDRACYFMKKASKAGSREAQIFIIDNCQ